jgi:hypothetical protein
VAEFEELGPADIEVRAIPFEGAEVVAFGDDLPRVADPELAQARVEVAGGGDHRAAVARL